MTCWWQHCEAIHHFDERQSTHSKRFEHRVEKANGAEFGRSCPCSLCKNLVGGVCHRRRKRSTHRSDMAELPHHKANASRVRVANVLQQGFLIRSFRIFSTILLGARSVVYKFKLNKSRCSTNWYESGTSCTRVGMSRFYDEY